MKTYNDLDSLEYSEFKSHLEHVIDNSDSYSLEYMKKLKRHNEKRIKNMKEFQLLVDVVATDVYNKTQKK